MSLCLVYLKSAEALNEQRWRPRKDFVADRLVAAQLQLAGGTLLMVDETKMSEGQLPGFPRHPLASSGAKSLHCGLALAGQLHLWTELK